MCQPFCIKSVVYRAAGQDRDAELLEYLNNPSSSLDQLPPASVLQRVESTASAPTPPTPLKVEETQQQHSDEIAMTRHHHHQVDPTAENRLLHSEVASLNQEVDCLVRRNKRAERDCQQYKQEVNNNLEAVICCYFDQLNGWRCLAANIRIITIASTYSNTSTAATAHTTNTNFLIL